MQLNQGDIVLSERIIDVDLSRRETIAGVRYGIEGMRVGGHRTFIVPPHLGYREKGVIGKIPPNAALRCEVTLLAVDRSE